MENTVKSDNYEILLILVGVIWLKFCAYLENFVARIFSNVSFPNS